MRRIQPIKGDKIESTPDALGNPIRPGAMIAFPQGGGSGMSLRFVLVLEVVEGEPSSAYREDKEPRLRVLGVSSNYRDDPATWETYQADIERVDRCITIDPNQYNDKLRWLERQAAEQGLT